MKKKGLLAHVSSMIGADGCEYAFRDKAYRRLTYRIQTVDFNQSIPLSLSGIEGLLVLPTVSRDETRIVCIGLIGSKPTVVSHCAFNENDILRTVWAVRKASRDHLLHKKSGN